MGERTKLQRLIDNILIILLIVAILTAVQQKVFCKTEIIIDYEEAIGIGLINESQMQSLNINKGGINGIKEEDIKNGFEEN